MNEELILTTLMIVVGVVTLLITLLTVMLTVVAGMVGYVTWTLPKRLEGDLKGRLFQNAEQFRKTNESRLGLFELLIDTLTTDAAALDPKKFKDELYALRHIWRLADTSPDSIRKSLSALEGMGTTVDHLLPYAERIRHAGTWPRDCDERFERLLSERRRRAGQ